MKLGEFFDLFDPLTDVVIWHEDESDDGDEPVFIGAIFDAPYGWLNSEIVTEKNSKDKDWDGIWLNPNINSTSEKGGEKVTPGLIITIR
jgi:hypothetical protein